MNAKVARRRLAARLQYACPRVQLISPKDSKWVSELVARWQERRITNYAFLQRLNTLAGRTYNDLNQCAPSLGQPAALVAAHHDHS